MYIVWAARNTPLNISTAINDNTGMKNSVYHIMPGL